MILTYITHRKTPDTQQAGTWYTAEELTLWRKRLSEGVEFCNPGDVKPNSPGIGENLKEKAEKLVANPFLDRYTGPTHYGASITLSSTDYIRDSSSPESQNKGDNIFSAAVMAVLTDDDRYKYAAKTAILDALSQKILDFPDYRSTWPDNGTRWNPKGHHNWNNPMFAFAQFFKNLFKGFDLLKDGKAEGKELFSEWDKGNCGSVFYRAAKYLVDSCNDELDNYVTNRDPLTNFEAKGYAVKGSDQGLQSWRIFDGGPYISNFARHWNNRLADQYYYGLLVGLQRQDPYLIKSFYLFFVEWLKYSCYYVSGNTFPGEMERGSNSRFREHSYSYACIQVGIMWSGARLHDNWMKNNPDQALTIYGTQVTPLLDYKTSEGSFGSEGGPKSIESGGRSILKIACKELKITYGGHVLDGYLPAAENKVNGQEWFWTEDVTLAALMNLKLNDPWIRKSYLREHPGSRPFPAGGNGSGAWPTYSGWGGTEYELFFKAGLEGQIK